MHRFLLISFSLLFFYSGLSAQLDLLGKVMYDYTAKQGGANLSPESYVFYNMNFACGTELSITASEIPFTDYVVEKAGSDLLLAEKDGLLLWKGLKGSDPFFGVPDRYIQFIGGVPLFNTNDPVDFNSKGDASFFLEFDVTDLLQELSVWAMIMEYEKIRCHVTVAYETEYLGTYTAFGEDEEEAHLLAYDIQMIPKDFAAKKKDDWIDLVETDHPEFKKIMTTKLIKEQRICNLNHPLGIVKLSEEPEYAVSFLRSEREMDLPECIEGKNSIYVYPNPTFGDLSLELSHYENGTYTFAIYNVAGREIWQTDFEVIDSTQFVKEIELPDIESGLYLYNIVNSKGAYLQSRRLIIVEQ